MGPDTCNMVKKWPISLGGYMGIVYKNVFNLVKGFVNIFVNRSISL